MKVMEMTVAIHLSSSCHSCKKDKIIPVLNYIIKYYVMEAYREWKYSSTILDFKTR
jgi:hypothetical protein